jgi:hypothetical protein
VVRGEVHKYLMQWICWGSPDKEAKARIIVKEVSKLEVEEWRAWGSLIVGSGQDL